MGGNIKFVFLWAVKDSYNNNQMLLANFGNLHEKMNRLIYFTWRFMMCTNNMCLRGGLFHHHGAVVWLVAARGHHGRRWGGSMGRHAAAGRGDGPVVPAICTTCVRSDKWKMIVEKIYYWSQKLYFYNNLS